MYGFDFNIGGNAIKSFQTMLGNLNGLQGSAKAVQTAFNAVKLPTQKADFSKPFVPVKAAIDSAKGSLDGFDNKLKAIKSTGSDTFGSLKSQVLGYGASVVSAQALFSSLGKTADKGSLETSIKFSGGADGNANLAFVNKSINDLKLPTEAAFEGFRTLSGGLMGTSITGKQTQAIFTSVAQASTVLGMKADETKGSLLALAQMASKGTVSAEELRGQLVERLPGAFGIAARAMKVSQQELGKMLEGGKIMAADFLPKFAAEMKRCTG
jgi:tape measure domain-containing protein